MKSKQVRGVELDEIKQRAREHVVVSLPLSKQKKVLMRVRGDSRGYLLLLCLY